MSAYKQKKMKTKIGIFDSGIGGFSIAQHLLGNPHLHLYYYADTANMPYGEKSPELIQQASKRAVEYLEKKGCSKIIIACHTACAIAGPYLEQQFPHLTFIHVLKHSIEQTIKINPQAVGILATTATIQSHVHKSLLLAHNPAMHIIEQACPELASLIEDYTNNKEIIKKYIIRYIKPLKQHNLDAILLGCTHYNFVKKEIKNIIGQHIKLISSEQVITIKQYDYEKVRKKNTESNIDLYVTGKRNYPQLDNIHSMLMKLEKVKKEI